MSSGQPCAPSDVCVAAHRDFDEPLRPYGFARVLRDRHVRVRPGYADVDSLPSSASCVGNDTLVSLKVHVGINQGRCGNLTIKVTSPGGQVSTLLSRPGFQEVADDGSATGSGPNGPSGDQTDLDANYPITFDDGATADAETMGAFIKGGGLAVCRDAETEPGGTGGNVCEYKPNPDAAGGPSTLSGAFAGKGSAGVWKLCVGDSDYDGTGTGVGTLVSWKLELKTVAGPVPAVIASGLALGIPDDGYPTQTACNTDRAMTPDRVCRQ